MRKPGNFWKLCKLATHTLSLSMTILITMTKIVPGGAVPDLKNLMFF